MYSVTSKRKTASANVDAITNFTSNKIILRNNKLLIDVDRFYRNNKTYNINLFLNDNLYYKYIFPFLKEKIIVNKINKLENYFQKSPEFILYPFELYIKYIQNYLKVEYAKMNKIEYGEIKLFFELIQTKNIFLKIKGGGSSSQAEVSRLAFSKYINKFSKINFNYAMHKEIKIIFKKYKLLTTNSKIKERKKYGLKRARKAPQFSKR